MRVRRVEVATAPLVQVATPDDDDLSGAYVKVSPRLSAAERSAYDAAGAADAARKRGARAVVVVPEVERDGSAAAAGHETTPSGGDPVVSLRDWIRGSASVPEVKERAASLAAEVLGAAGVG